MLPLSLNLNLSLKKQNPETLSIADIHKAQDRCCSLHLLSQFVEKPQTLEFWHQLPEEVKELLRRRQSAPADKERLDVDSIVARVDSWRDEITSTANRLMASMEEQLRKVVDSSMKLHLHAEWLSQPTSSLWLEVTVRRYDVVAARYEKLYAAAVEYRKSHYLKQPIGGWSTSEEAEAHIFSNINAGDVDQPGVVRGCDELARNPDASRTAEAITISLPGLDCARLRMLVAAPRCLEGVRDAESSQRKRQRETGSHGNETNVAAPKQPLASIEDGFLGVYYVSSLGAAFLGNRESTQSIDRAAQVALHSAASNGATTIPDSDKIRSRDADECIPPLKLLGESRGFWRSISRF